ncbi:hypothetical protein SAMN05421820_11615 [Pedobacter steynii]|uniref:Uncharacterized protein n=1 Tax=Pedobacter steynii TaxID=430522 RepID=A0A1H0KCA5_9SPHI|nr:hypothetical protein SAMN05421820_11615 [Pedobacter steynii]
MIRHINPNLFVHKLKFSKYETEIAILDIVLYKKFNINAHIYTFASQ